MSLITENKPNFTGGVNQQPPEHRLDTQVEEMINCLPTIDRGLRRRNPTENLPLTYLDGAVAQMTFDDDMWTYEYNKGTGDDTDEFSFSITSQGGLQIVNITNGTYYDELNGITFEGDGLNYLNLFGGRNGYSATTVKDTVFIVNKLKQPKMIDSTEQQLYLREGYVWIEKVDVIEGYQYGATIYLKEDATGISTEIVVPPLREADPTFKDTVLIANGLATRITASSALLNANSSGSIVQIQCSAGYTVESVNATDSFGDNASFGWGHQVDTQAELPHNLGTYTPLVQIGTTDRNSTWFLYQDGSWKEHYEIGIQTEMRDGYMPHTISREFNPNTGFVEFFVRPYTWDSRQIGDDTTNKLPQFLQEEFIKDIFFFRNRMGLITSGGITLSEVGEYGNFWRTSTGALLEGDRIDSSIESRTAIKLEYSVVFDDSVILFSNNSQFRFEGGNVLSPSSYKITEILSYEVNLNIRPLGLNGKLYFVTKRGEYSALHEMVVSNQSTTTTSADDITSHCQAYIHGDVDRLTGSSVNSMLFIGSRRLRNTIFVYRFYEEGRTKSQSAWSKWEFDGRIFASFALGKAFHLLIDRNDAIDESDWILGSGRWNMDKVWKMAFPWIMSPATIASVPQFETMDIFPQNINETFLDNRRTSFMSFVNFGEWVTGAEGNKEIRGTLQFKTVQFSHSMGSQFDLWARNKTRGTTEVTDWKYIEGRKPPMYGDVKEVEVGIRSDKDTGFELASVSFEGNLNRRATAR
ncbi:MAG: hypothetical protein DRP70_17080 [Spirochaetes bacterium]|nr:MAG: hypothetical protein DRP70_17080 [Spirochaetota bacterium]